MGTFVPPETEKDGASNATLFNLTELRAKLGNRSRSAIYTDLEAGRLPQPVKLGGRLYWLEGDVKAHLRAMSEKAA